MKIIPHQVRASGLVLGVAFSLLGVALARTALGAEVSEGTVCGWVLPSDPVVATLTNATGKTCAELGIHRYDWARAQLHLANGKTVLFTGRMSHLMLRGDEFVHLALTWTRDGRVRLFVNGRPAVGERPEAKENRLSEGVGLVCASDCTRDFRLENRAWTAAEVYAAYRRECPLDLVMDDALAKGRIAAAHYWLFTCPVNAMVMRHAQFDDVRDEARMHRDGRNAVSCAAATFMRAGGRLFSPDRTWDGQTYGRVGNATVTARNVESIDRDAPDRDLFKGEAYGLDAYKMRLPAGRYRVKLYARWGYPAAFENPKIDLRCAYFVNGKNVSDGYLDFRRAQGGFYSRPNPVEGDVLKSAVVTVATRTDRVFPA